VDMAVGIIIGAAFGTIVTSLVKDIIMPPIGLLLGGVDFSNLFLVLKQGATPSPYGSLAAAQEQNLPLLDEMNGHPSMARFREAGYELITF